MPGRHAAGTVARVTAADADLLPALRPRAVVGRVLALVRRPRPRSALASSGHLGVGGDGQRVHAAADPGRAGPRTVGRLAGSLADSGGAGGRARRRGGAGLGPARLPAPRAAAAPGCRGDHRTVRRAGAAGPGVPPQPAGRRLLHRGGDHQLRLRAARGRAGHQRPSGDRPGGARRGLSDNRPEPARAAPWRSGSRHANRRGPPAGPWPRWSWAPWSVWPGPPAAATARSRDLCAWRRAGAPAWSGPPRRGQAYAGTDRQARGALLAVLRSADEPTSGDELAAAWSDPTQRERALTSLVADGLVVATGPDLYCLPD